MAADLLRERLPPDWSYGVTSDGRVFFVSERSRTTSWLHPVTGRPVQTGHQAAPGLPNGWEQDFTPEGATYFIDHNNQQTTFGHPVTGRPISEEDPPPPPSSPPQSPTDRSDFKRGTSKQRSLKAPSAKRNPTAQVVRRGFLYRLESGGLGKTWKRRWCVLADFALFIYKNDDEKVGLGSILLPSYRIVPCSAEDPVQKDFAFKLEHENTKTVYFHTDSLSDFNDWLPHLQQAATMKGNTGFTREANNNIKLLAQRSPPYTGPHRDHPDKWGGSHPNLDQPSQPQWRNPSTSQGGYPSKGPASPNNNFQGQPAWRSVPDLGRENMDPRNGSRDVGYDPHGSLRSLPQDVYRPRQDFGPYVPRESGHIGPKGLPQGPQYRDQRDNGYVSDRDPRGSMRSLPNDAHRQSRDFPSSSQLGLAGSNQDVTRNSLPRSGFQPYQRQGDSQRSSMVSDSGRQGAPDSGSYNVQQQQRNAPLASHNPNYSNHDRMRGSLRGQGPHDVSTDSMGSYRPDLNRQRSDGSREGSMRDRDPAGWRGSRTGSRGFDPASRDPSRQYSPNEGRHPGDPRGSSSRLVTPNDPRASYASSGRHSLAGPNHSMERDPRDRNSYPHPHHGSRNSLSRVPPAPHHSSDGHTYVNVPEMRSQALEQQESLPPQRPPYPAAVREQIVRELADTRSPATAEMLIRSHEMNKERMQQSSYFQYPTPPRDQPVSRVDASPNGGAIDPVKRLSQYSDRNSLASGQHPSMQQGVPGDRGSRSQRGSSNDYSDSGRRQDSGSGRFSDSFERRSGDERRPEETMRKNRAEDVPPSQRFGGDEEARSLRQAYERVQSFRQSSAAELDGKGLSVVPPESHAKTGHKKRSSEDMAKLGKGYCYAFFPDSEDPADECLPSARDQPPDSNISTLRSTDSIDNDHGILEDGMGSVTRRSAPSRGEETPHNTTLSPCGSYHHIDLDIDQLYQRGSAFRPPSSVSGSVRGDSNFHSLPRSYKFRSNFDPAKGGFAEQSFRSESSKALDRPELGSSQDAQWEWYKNNILSPRIKTQGNSFSTSNLDAAVSSGYQPEKPPRSASYLNPLNSTEPFTYSSGAHSGAEWANEWHSPDGCRDGSLKRHSKPSRSTAYKYHPDSEQAGSADNYQRHSAKDYYRNKTNYEHQYNSSVLQDRFLQSWPNRDLLSTSRDLDVPTPSSLSSHPFFVPEDQPVSPTPETRTEADQLHTSHPHGQTEGEARNAHKGKVRGDKRPIQTVREEPDMPDSDVLETRLKKKYPLNGVRLRMSISAGDLIGKTHDELVLLLIQLRRNQAALGKARDFYREVLSKRRPAEREYRRQRHDSTGRLERSMEEEHQSFIDTRFQLEEIEKKLEVYRPLINLVDNMVTMGSLYGGDNLMLATQYRKHLLRPDQYQPPRKMLEFSRKHQEERVVASLEADVRQLTAAEVDLEEKIERLNQLERLLQEQSFKVSSFREDKELLEKALQGIMKQQEQMAGSPRELHRLAQQQATVEKELSRVTQDLAEASKALEETTVENNKIEHEVALLRTKVHGELKRSKSAPSLVTENTNAKVKMERELARVQNMLQGLSQQGEKLSNAMSTIRRSSSGTQLAAAFDEAERVKKAGTYLQTDLDSGEQVDLAQQIPMQSPVSPNDSVTAGERPVISHQRQDSTLGLNDTDSSREWDIGDADDNTKRFYGLLPKEKPRGLTVRDVKRQSEQRRERKRDEEVQDVPLKVSSTDSEVSTFIHARNLSYASSQSSGLDLSGREQTGPLYENLPRSGSMPALNNGSAPSSRRSSITLMAPKPFTPYQDRTAKPFKSELALNSSEQLGYSDQGNGSFQASKPYMSDLALNSAGTRLAGVQQDPIAAGHVGLVTARPLRIGPPGTQGMSKSLYTSTAQPFSRDYSYNQPSHVRTPSSEYTRPGEGDEARQSTNIQPGLLDVKRSPKGRYLTVSSSEPAKLESESLKNSAFHSPAGDLISNTRVDDVPDVVKSSLTNVDKIDQIDEDMIDREVLYRPEKVLIPERYDPEADEERLTEAEKLARQEKSERIKRLLTNQSVLSMSQPDINRVPPSQLHNEVLREKQERAQLLTLGQELARQVTLQSKKAAAERRKTWSGGQISDIKKQYEAELAANPGRFQPGSPPVRRSNVLL